MRHLLPALLVGVAVLGAGVAGAQSEWPQFRGRDAGVAADDPALPESWGRTQNVAWSTEVPGRGWGSPVVSGDHVWLTSVVAAGEVEAARPGLYFGGERPAPTVAHRWMLHDIDFRSGRIRWQRELHHSVPGGPRHLKNSYASETPVTDGERVYAYLARAGLFAFDLTGQTVWSKPAPAFDTRYGWGTAASPVLHGDRLYIVNDNDTRSFLAAYDKRSGQELWRVDRDEGTNWTTPLVWTHDDTAEIVTSGSGAVRSYSLDGQLLWQLKGMSTIAIPTPFARHGLLFIASGYVADAVRPTYAIRQGARGDISLKPGETSNAFVAWSHPTLGPYNPTPLVYGDILYTLLDRGFLTAHDARTGKEVYPRQRISATASGFTASPWAYNGKVFVLSEEGETFVIQAGPEFKLLRSNPLEEMTLASPAVARGSVIIRTATKLYRID